MKKYTYGTPFPTEAMVVEIPAETGTPAYGCVNCEEGFTYTLKLGEKDKIFGLGENVRGMNKRGNVYINNCADDPNHREDTKSLYGAHNLLLISGEKTFGLFFDYPAKMTFDIGFTRADLLEVTAERADLDLYVIEGESLLDIVKQFRHAIGRSYIPPKFAFGYGQSRWGYVTADDFRYAADSHRNAHIPLDMVYMDIDYMDHYKDFTVNENEFPDLAAYVQEMKDKHIHLVPIIDAGVKIEEGYDVYEEGVKNGYFIKRKDGSDFEACVWPGYTHFPDVLNPEARKWFGDKYERLVSKGIDGFWNDMNEPAIFYTPESIARTEELMKRYLAGDGVSINEVGDAIRTFPNSESDRENMYHNVNGQMVCHKDVHNLFGYNMTRAAGEAFERMCPDKRILMYSRSSYVGMHRYGGIWQGDNLSWWSHLLMNLKMMPSLNMVGILYTGADLGGFGADTSRDLLLRWLALGMFTPLMRNHSAQGTRRQEFYQFEGAEDFRHMIGVRYRLVPYLYSEYMKAALRDEMMFKPLAFVYPEDEIACQIEDQVMFGEEVMIAPVVEQNAAGRFVYLPEEMMFVKFLPDGTISQEVMPAGMHFVKIALNEAAFFIRQGKKIPVADAAEYVDAVDYSTIQLLGYPEASYELYNDDGLSKDYENPANFRMM